jgi:hypothetical protein
MFVKCIRISKKAISYKRVIPGKKYLLLGISNKYYRVLDEDNEPALYPKPWFDKIFQIPLNWIKEKHTKGEYHIYPPELNEKGFFEKWFDKDPTVLKKWIKYLNANQKN